MNKVNRGTLAFSKIIYLDLMNNKEQYAEFLSNIDVFHDVITSYYYVDVDCSSKLFTEGNGVYECRRNEKDFSMEFRFLRKFNS